MLGAHSVGHVHIEHSLYGTQSQTPPNNLDNAFDNTPAIFDNHYFINLKGQVRNITITIILTICLILTQYNSLIICFISDGLPIPHQSCRPISIYGQIFMILQ